MNLTTKIKLGLGSVGALFMLIILLNIFGHVQVEGNEAVVRQHWREGVVNEVYRDGTHFYFPGIAWDVYKYNIGTQKITFDNKESNQGAEYSRIIVNVGEGGGQEARIAMSVNYRIGHSTGEGGTVFDAGKLVALHKDGIGKNYEDVVVKRTIVDVVNQVARPRGALDIYSGKGFVEFKETIDKELRDHPVFKSRGIFVENTIVYKVYLDPKYENEIAQKQIAIQQKLRKIEETKVAEEEAKRVFAMSQAEVESRTQKAEAKKIEQVKAAEAQMESDKLRAEGVLAIGRAEAEIEALKRDALYHGPSGAWRAKVHIATKQAEKLAGMFRGVQIVPEKTILRAGEGAGFSSGLAIGVE